MDGKDSVRRKSVCLFSLQNMFTVKHLTGKLLLLFNMVKNKQIKLCIDCLLKLTANKLTRHING